MTADLWLALSAFAALGSMAALAYWRLTVVPAAQLRRRLAALGTARPTPVQDGEAGAGARRHLIQGKLKELERQRHRSRRDTVPHLILQSGLPLSLRDFVLAGVGVAALTLIGLWLSGISLPVALLGAVGSGLLLPRVVLLTIVRRRQARFGEHFADALDILVRGTRSGLPVGECLRIVARESPDPVGPEFDLLTQSDRLGMSLKEALARSVDRVPAAELRFFAIVLLIQQQTGGNLAGTLEKLSAILRARKRLRDRVQALSSEAKASAGIIGALPFIVTGALALLSPDYIALLFTERLGNFLLYASLAWMAIGIAIMRKMINFGM